LGRILFNLVCAAAVLNQCTRGGAEFFAGKPMAKEE